MGGEYELGGKFVPKKVPILKFLQKYANFEIFPPHLCKFWQFVPKNSQILTIFAQKGGKTGKGIKKLSFLNGVQETMLVICRIYTSAEKISMAKRDF